MSRWEAPNTTWVYRWKGPPPPASHIAALDAFSEAITAQIEEGPIWARMMASWSKQPLQGGAHFLQSCHTPPSGAGVQILAHCGAYGSSLQRACEDYCKWSLCPECVRHAVLWGCTAHGLDLIPRNKRLSVSRSKVYRRALAEKTYHFPHAGFEAPTLEEAITMSADEVQLSLFGAP